ncbi:MAG TPA: MlaD family protein [Solirubrobacteraceae bacterium]|jgi:ABC-type transporter Mla subunit MlaD|nr:MlaD family protein [Solirubrobacteraceae bacterium]
MSRRRWWRRHDEVPVVELQRAKPVRTGIIVVVIVALVTYFGFTKHIPFKHGFKLKAEFATAVNIKPKSPVRIAGVNVGKVSSIQRQGKAGLVTMEIETRGLPIHSDATLKIRPRIFLEGNWFIELQPGSPSANTVSSGHTIPITQTSDPVQLDQVLDALNTDTRANLQTLLIEYGKALTQKPNVAADAEQDPEVRGLNAAQALNKTYSHSVPALRGTAVLNQAITGTEQHDLSKLIASIDKVSSGLNVHEQQLGELIGNFNTFAASLASQSSSLERTVAELPSSLHNIHAALTSLDASFAPTRAFAHDILPGITSIPATTRAALPWIEQVKASLSPSELGGVAKGLAESLPGIAGLEGEQSPFFKQTDLFNKCLTNVILPAGNVKLQDGSSTTGVEDYKEFWYSLVGLNGIGDSFDGNGTTGKFLVGTSGQTLKSQKAQVLGEGAHPKSFQLLARSPNQPLGTRPAYPASEPEYKPLVSCYTQTLPNFNGPLSQGPADGNG